MLRMGFCKPVRFKLNLTGKLSVRNKTVLIHKIGDILVDGFHYLALFVIGATIVWSALHDYIGMMKSGHANLEEILLLFIYLELGAMVGTYFKTRRLARTVFDLYRHHCAISPSGDRCTKSGR